MEILLFLAAVAVAYYFYKQKNMSFQKPTEVSPHQTASVVSPAAEAIVTEQPAATPELTKLAKAEVVTPLTTRSPEDSVLSRHYAAQQRAKQLAITNPYPSDSVLRRHYESRFKLGITNKVAVMKISHEEVPSQAHLEPQDSILKRHYAQLLKTQAA